MNATTTGLKVESQDASRGKSLLIRDPCRHEHDLLELTACVVASFVASHAVTPGDIPEIINLTYGAFAKLRRAERGPAVATTPAVPIAQSIADDYLVCLEDGRRLKTLKRYLRLKYDLTPQQYRARWGLPPDYPMVAPGYARLRSSLARRGPKVE